MNEMNQIKYKLVKRNEVPELSVIEVSNYTAKITLADTLASLKYNRDAVVSLEAELGIKRAIIKNIEQNHPGVTRIPQEMRIACQLYCEADKYIELGQNKIDEYKNSIVELEKEVVEIKAQTGIEKISEVDKLKIIKKINTPNKNAKSKKTK